jgi:hypothetical protein
VELLSGTVIVAKITKGERFAGQSAYDGGRSQGFCSNQSLIIRPGEEPNQGAINKTTVTILYIPV